MGSGHRGLASLREVPTMSSTWHEPNSSRLTIMTPVSSALLLPRAPLSLAAPQEVELTLLPTPHAAQKVLRAEQVAGAGKHSLLCCLTGSPRAGASSPGLERLQLSSLYILLGQTHGQRAQKLWAWLGLDLDALRDLGEAPACGHICPWCPPSTHTRRQELG